MVFDYRLLPLLTAAAATACGGGGGGASPGNASVTVSWVAPTTRVDGTPLSLAEIDGFDLVYGLTRESNEHEVHIADPHRSSYTLTGLPHGEYYIALRTYNIYGQSGPLSRRFRIVID